MAGSSAGAKKGWANRQRGANARTTARTLAGAGAVWAASARRAAWNKTLKQEKRLGRAELMRGLGQTSDVARRAMAGLVSTNNALKIRAAFAGSKRRK